MCTTHFINLFKWFCSLLCLQIDQLKNFIKAEINIQENKSDSFCFSQNLNIVYDLHMHSGSLVAKLEAKIN